MRTDARATFACVAAVLVATLALAPGAAGMPSNPPDRSWATNGRVSAIVQIGNTVYVGGSFTQLVEKGGAGPQVLPRNRLAAFNATTGAPTDWAPDAGDDVLALAKSPDESRIYAGGAFTTVNGSPRQRLAAIDPSGTGDLDPSWQPPPVSADVLAIAATAGRVYASGYFNIVGGQTRPRLAAFSAEGGALDPTWTPKADAAVRTLALSPDGNRVFAGGKFTTISGQSRKNAVALSATGGEVIAGWHPDPGVEIFSVALKNNTIYMAVGGNWSTSGVAAWDATTGRKLWHRHADGDLHALAISGNVLYAGGHQNYFEGERRGKLFALDTATGALIRAWNPRLTGITWGGVWALSTHGTSRLVAGGDFDRAAGVEQEYYAQWTGAIGQAPPVTPVRPPTTVPAVALLDPAPLTASGFSLVRASFAVAARPTPIAARRRRAKLGSAFRFKLSKAARVRIVIERVLPRRRGGRRYKKAGVLRRAGRRGRNRVPFSGRVGKRPLRAGRYRATLIAADANGNRAAPRRLRLRIVRRARG